MGLVEVGIDSDNERKRNNTEQQKLRKKGCSDSENKLLEHPPIAQLVERRTVEVVDILRSLVRIRVSGVFCDRKKMLEDN